MEILHIQHLHRFTHATNKHKHRTDINPKITKIEKNIFIIRNNQVTPQQLHRDHNHKISNIMII